MSKQTNYFFKQIETQHLSHAYLFLGSNQVEKEKTTNAIIKALGCPSFKREGLPCGNCEWCQRVEHQQLSDVMFLEPEGKGIKVDQIRELKEWLNRSPVEASFKVGVIKQADTMNHNAANALLTILEEPKSEIYLILFANSRENLLATILSRVQQVHFNQFKAEDLIERHSQYEYTSSQRRLFNYLSSQAVEELLTFSTEQLEEWIKATEQFYQALYQQNPVTFALIQTRLKNILTVQQLNLAIDYLMVLNHQALSCLITNMPSELQLINDLIQKPNSTERLLKMNQIFLEARKYLQANVAPQLVAEKIALDSIYRKGANN